MYEVAISHHITPKLSVFLGKNNRNNENNYNMFKCMGERKRMKEQQGTFIVLYVESPFVL